MYDRSTIFIQLIPASSFHLPDDRFPEPVKLDVVTLEYVPAALDRCEAVFDQEHDPFQNISGPGFGPGMETADPRLRVRPVEHEEVRKVRHGDAQIGARAIVAPDIRQAKSSFSAIVHRP